MSNNDIGKSVRDIRERSNMTLEELGSRIGKTKQWLSELERGNIRLTYEMAVKIAQVYDGTPDIFLGKESKNISRTISADEDCVTAEHDPATGLKRDQPSAVDETCATLEKVG